MKEMLDKTHGPDPGNMTRLLMQIRPALDSERAASDSVPDTPEELAAHERPRGHSHQLSTWTASDG
jgi:hypothetical protein